VKRIRVGIIGQGRSGRDIHAHSLTTVVPDLYEIVAVADPLPDRCDRAAKELGCRAYPDYRKLLACDDIDLVVNASPSRLHVPLTLEALEAGFDVLCE
jgi:predicted dehydrogenase